MVTESENILDHNSICKGLVYLASEQSVPEVKMCTNKDLTDFDRDQIVMARRPGQSILKRAGLFTVYCVYQCPKAYLTSSYKKYS